MPASDTTSRLDPAAVRAGRVKGRYFRENFAQGGLDLAQVVPELVTNADGAIAASGRSHGRIELSIARPDADLIAAWKAGMRRLRSPGILGWRHELRCLDDGEGVNARLVEQRLGALGVTPAGHGQRGLFGRGLRDVWLAQGGGRIEGVRAGRLVETWFFPSGGDDPYAYAHVRDEPATDGDRRAIGLPPGRDGTRVTVPLAGPLGRSGRLRTLVARLVQLRPVLEDPDRELWLALPGEPAQLVVPIEPQTDAERPLLLDREVRVGGAESARIVVRRAAEPFTGGLSRATRPGGLVVRSGRAAHESTLASMEGQPGSRHLYGEVWCEAIERLQREALESPRPQVVVKVDRSGLNEHHPFVIDLYRAIDEALRPIVADEERRAGARRLAAGRRVQERDQVGLTALNDALRRAFDRPGAAGFNPGDGDGGRRPAVLGAERPSANGSGPVAPAPAPPERGPAAPLRFKRSPIRLRPGETRTVSLIFDPARIPPGTPVELACDRGLSLSLADEAPPPGPGGWARLSGGLRSRVTVDPGARLRVVAEAGDHVAELEVLVVRHTSSGWVREIARTDEDAQLEATFDPETGVVTVYEGRPEFRALERAARRSGLSKRRRAEYLPYRMLEVEVAANAVYQWAAERIVERRAIEERLEPVDHARAVHVEAQDLRHRFHAKLMRAFLDPEVFDGGARLAAGRSELSGAQGALL